MARLEAALAQPVGASQDAGLASKAPAAATTGPPPESAETATQPTAAPATPNLPTLLPGALATTPIDPAPASGTAKADGGEPEPADAPIRAPSKPAAGPTRGGRPAVSEPDASGTGAAPDPAAPADVAPLDIAALLPAVAASSMPPGGAQMPGPLTRSDTPGGAPPTAAAPRDEGAPRTEREPTHTTPQDQAPAAPKPETPPVASEAAPARSLAETATDPTKAAIGVAHEAPSAEAVARAMAEANQPPASPAGRATPASQPTADPARAEIASPAQQLAAPLVALGTGPDQSRHMTVRLDPAALGSVQVRIDQPKDGPARVEVTVERPETLSLLLRDQPQLQRALDQAGIPPEGRSVVFQIATPDSQARSDAPLPDHRQSSDGQPAAGDAGARSASQGGGGNGGGFGRSRRDGAEEDSSLFRFTPSAAQRWSGDGLDITA